MDTEVRKDNSNEKENKKTELKWKEQIVMITVFATFGLIPLIPVMGISVISFSGLISIISIVWWKCSEKNIDDNVKNKNNSTM